MAKQALASTVDLEPIDRLEEKIGLLVGMITQLRAEKAQSLDTNARLTAEIEQLRARLADAESVNTELVGAARRTRGHPDARQRDAAATGSHLN